MKKKLWDSLPKGTQETLDELFREFMFHWSNTIDILEQDAKDIAVEKFYLTAIDQRLDIL